MLNSTENEISNARKYENIKKLVFQAQISLEFNFSCSLMFQISFCDCAVRENPILQSKYTGPISVFAEIF